MDPRMCRNVWPRTFHVREQLSRRTLVRHPAEAVQDLSARGRRLHARRAGHDVRGHSRASLSHLKLSTAHDSGEPMSGLPLVAQEDLDAEQRLLCDYLLKCPRAPTLS